MKRNLTFVVAVWMALSAWVTTQVWAQHATPLQSDGSSQASDAQRIEHVILVSVDGLMPEAYMHPEAHGLKIPTLREIVRNGAYSEGARSVFPTMTYPAHSTIATGANPGTHGITMNQAWDPMEKNQEGWRWYAEDFRVPPIWEVARRAGLKTALVWWPVTVGAKATAVMPEIWRASTPEDAKLARALATPGLLEEVEKRHPDFRSRFNPPGVKDDAVTDIATYLIETMKPSLLMVHMFEVDHWQHEEGLYSKEAVEAIENADAQIARLITAAKQAGTWEKTALVVVSDHGFARTTKRVKLGILLVQKGLVTLDDRNRVKSWKATVITGGGSAFFYLKDRNDQQTRDALKEMLKEVVRKKDGGVGRLYTQEEIRALGGDRDAVMAAEASEGYAMSWGYTGEYIADARNKAAHGYDPRRADMQASLLVYGPGIAPGKIEGARLIDVAPTVARWLGLKMKKTEGKAIEILEK